MIKFVKAKFRPVTISGGKPALFAYQFPGIGLRHKKKHPRVGWKRARKKAENINRTQILSFVPLDRHKQPSKHGRYVRNPTRVPRAYPLRSLWIQTRNSRKTT